MRACVCVCVCLILVCNEVVTVVSSFGIFSLGKGKLVVLTLSVSLLPYGYLCSVSLPRGAVDWFVACDCGTS